MTIYICCGAYGGFKLEFNRDKGIYRIMLGWVSLAFLTWDIEKYITKMTIYTYKLERQLNVKK